MTNVKIVRNKDNDHVLPRRFGRTGRAVFGYVDEVNGPGAAEITDFIPTKHELLQLVKFWTTEPLPYEFFEEFQLGQACSSGMRLSAFAWRRIARVRKLLGEEQVQEAIEEARAEFGKKQDPRLWEIFMHGDDKDWQAVWEEINPSEAEH